MQQDTKSTNVTISKTLRLLIIIPSHTLLLFHNIAHVTVLATGGSLRMTSIGVLVYSICDNGIKKVTAAACVEALYNYYCR